MSMRTSIPAFATACSLILASASVGDPPLKITLRSRDLPVGTKPENVAVRTVDWDPKKSCIIVCDMWDDHWCKSASRRVAELAGPMNEMLKTARAKGVFIIHAPSSVVAFYQNTPQRKRAMEAPLAKLPVPIPNDDRWGTKWVYADPSREPKLPINDSDMGCDCAVKCKVREAWTRQIATIEIAPEDAISDNGGEVYNLLTLKQIDNVALVGVHLNMCVLGRPFALRQMARFGKHVALMRDMTDTMYNPEMSPKVNHFKGTDLVVEHVERYVCPTFLSSDVTGKPAFRFNDAPRDR